MPHTRSASSQASEGERCSRANEVRGPKVAQPTGTPASYASTPWMRPSRIPARNLSRRGSPLSASKRSPFSRRQNMHQHPAHAPRGPNSLSTSFQAAGVRTAVVSAIGAERCHGRACGFQVPAPAQRVVERRRRMVQWWRPPSVAGTPMTALLASLLLAAAPPLVQLETYTCLLYTSDAADERSSVDLGGRRITKKKKIKD